VSDDSHDDLPPMTGELPGNYGRPAPRSRWGAPAVRTNTAMTPEAFARAVADEKRRIKAHGYVETPAGRLQLPITLRGGR
jgi:hypothetical protein